MNITEQLKKDLWKYFGATEYPAEWDGIVYGGGKLSQRFWEYLVTIQYLNLNSDSTLLEIGGGSPQTGYGFFSAIIKQYVNNIIILDPNLNREAKKPDNIEYVVENADYENLKTLFNNYDITHVSCISVFEHIEDNARNEMIRAINDHFKGENFVATMEYHPKQVHFEHQLTSRTISELFSHFTNFYLREYSASPVLCENAFAKMQRLSLRKWRIKKTFTPRWYPVAVKFHNVND